MKRKGRRWTKFEEIDAEAVGLDPPAGCVRVLRNSRLFAFVFSRCETWLGDTTLVMLRDAVPRPKTSHDWADYQRAKAELFGTDALAFECYPPAGDLVDTAHMYWLWIVHDPKPDLWRQWQARGMR